LAETDLAILEQRQRKFCAANIDCKRIDAWSGLLICDWMSHDLPAFVVIKCGNGHVLRKRSHAAEVKRRNSDHFPLFAQIHLTSAAIEAMAAEHGRVKRHVLTWLKICDRPPYRFNNPGGFMSHDDRRETPSCTSVVSMHIASADATRLNANEQVIFTGLRLRHIDEVKLFVFRENERLHELSF
jgi:hypothetical protein